VNGFCSYILYRIRRAFDVICTFQCTSGSRPMALLIISDSKTDRKKKKPRDKRERESPVWQEGLDVISSMTVLSPPPPIFFHYLLFCSSIGKKMSLPWPLLCGWMNNFLIKRVHILYIDCLCVIIFPPEKCNLIRRQFSSFWFRSRRTRDSTGLSSCAFLP
jgi:hypothetical protein